jgi:NAD(P)-dependent dehydrogenase (short-subunit alcohol dehydrogenase family)
MIDLRNKTFVILGGTGGIGKPITKWLHEHGANVAVGARNRENLKSLQSELGRTRTLCERTDASHEGEVRKLLDQASERFGNIDCFIVSLGSWVISPLSLRPGDAILRHRHLNTTMIEPSIIASLEALKFLENQRRGGLFIHISSHVVEYDEEELSGNILYRGAKAMLETILWSVYRTYAKKNVRITNFRPSLVDTPENRALYKNVRDWSKAAQPSKMGKWIADNLGERKIDFIASFEGEIRV